MSEAVLGVVLARKRTRVCPRCHLEFSYEIGRGKDRIYCSKCSVEKRSEYDALSWQRQRQKRALLRQEYGVGERTILRAMLDAKKLELLEEDAAFEHWFSGFFDGEGYFRVRPVADGKLMTMNGRSFPRSSFGLALGIKLRADDIGILQKIQQYFKCGHIYYRKDHGKDGYNRNDQAVWTVDRQAELFHIFIPHFEKYPLRARKAEHYEVWKEAVKLAYKKQHLTKEGREKWNNLVQQLLQVREFRKPCLE